MQITVVTAACGYDPRFSGRCDMPGTDNPLQGRKQESNDDNALQDLGHPRGTLAIVLVFGALFLLGWLAMYVFMFLERGAPHP
jgi:hypothetical protein